MPLGVIMFQPFMLHGFEIKLDCSFESIGSLIPGLVKHMNES